jgi:hypothetical protein
LAGITCIAVPSVDPLQSINRVDALVSGCDPKL